MVYATGSVQRWMTMLLMLRAVDIFTFFNSLWLHPSSVMVSQTKCLEVAIPLYKGHGEAKHPFQFFLVFPEENTKYLFFLRRL